VLSVSSPILTGLEDDGAATPFDDDRVSREHVVEKAKEVAARIRCSHVLH
jgi:hypothetical protein